MDVLNGYRDSHRVSSDDDDSDDSDKECTVWKRATVKRTDIEESLPIAKEEAKLPPEQEKPVLKRKRNNIWSDVLQDQMMSEDLEECLLKNKPRNYGTRGKESYDYSLSRNYKKKDDDSNDSYMSDDTFAEEEPKSKRRCFRPDRNLNKHVELSDDERAAARKINKILNERKFYLISRVVKYVGIEKAMKLLNMTEQVEESGGMMIKDNSRRRTPGGVYLQLVRSDKEITQDILDKIFEGEMSPIELKKYYSTLKKKKRRNNFRNRQFKGEDELIRRAYAAEYNQMSLEFGSSKSNEPMEHDEIVPMDAEVINDASPEKSNLDNILPMPVQEKTSDLEEGEIED